MKNIEEIVEKELDNLTELGYFEKSWNPEKSVYEYQLTNKGIDRIKKAQSNLS